MLTTDVHQTSNLKDSACAQINESRFNLLPTYAQVTLLNAYLV